MRHYHISPRRKKIQMIKAKRTRHQKYGGRYMSRRGIVKVSQNLRKARAKLMQLQRG